jgi:hypothetical protein
VISSHYPHGDQVCSHALQARVSRHRQQSLSSRVRCPDTATTRSLCEDFFFILSHTPGGERFYASPGFCAFRSAGEDESHPTPVRFGPTVMSRLVPLGQMLIVEDKLRQCLISLFGIRAVDAFPRRLFRWAMPLSAYSPTPSSFPLPQYRSVQSDCQAKNRLKNRPKLCAG